MGNYNPRSWFNVSELIGCAMQVIFLVGGTLFAVGLLLYLILRR